MRWKPARAVSKLRLVIVATHPIQYQVPWFQALAACPELELDVYFGMLPDAAQQGAGFGVPFRWDIPMLDGYSWRIVGNARAKPALSYFFGNSVSRIHDEFRSRRPDAVLVTGWHALPLLQALWACMRLGIPRIVRGESNAMRLRLPWTQFGHRVLLSRFDAFLAIGKSNAEFYRSNGVPEARIFSAPYFVDNARFAGAARDLRAQRVALRRQWDIPADAVCFLFAGKLEPKKRILDLVRAMRAAQGGPDAAHLLVVGTGVQMGEAKALVDREGVRSTFAGFLNQSEMPRAYAAADCLVLPSDFGETWGLVVNEAMACGLPAVVSDRVGCGPDLVEEGVTGLRFPFGNVAALGDVLRSLARAPAQLAEMGLRARERVARYSVQAAVTGTLESARYVTQSRR